jgi:hypothetical protein
MQKEGYFPPPIPNSNTEIQIPGLPKITFDKSIAGLSCDIAIYEEGWRAVLEDLYVSPEQLREVQFVDRLKHSKY